MSAARPAGRAAPLPTAPLPTAPLPGPRQDEGVVPVPTGADALGRELRRMEVLHRRALLAAVPRHRRRVPAASSPARTAR